MQVLIVLGIIGACAVYAPWWATLIVVLILFV
jgi:hypothetical protein